MKSIYEGYASFVDDKEVIDAIAEWMEALAYAPTVIESEVEE